MLYRPRPIVTTEITLPVELMLLTERLAEHAHDVWANERMAQGWVYGPRNDASTKTHPSLVPYDALSESEKEIDRRVVLGTLKAILALGYRVEKP